MPSVFVPSALMREARRQKDIMEADVPAVCLLDPDGDLVRHLRRTGHARPFEGWPCYHTELDVFSLAGRQVGESSGGRSALPSLFWWLKSFWQTDAAC